jgi:hypothetical protein
VANEKSPVCCANAVGEIARAVANASKANENFFTGLFLSFFSLARGVCGREAALLGCLAKDFLRFGQLPRSLLGDFKKNAEYSARELTP